MFRKFKKENKNHKEINIILNDKSFADRRAYNDSFPNAKLQLCIFHVLQIFKREIVPSKMNITVNPKNEILKVLGQTVFRKNLFEFV